MSLPPLFKRGHSSYKNNLSLQEMVCLWVGNYCVYLFFETYMFRESADLWNNLNPLSNKVQALSNKIWFWQITKQLWQSFQSSLYMKGTWKCAFHDQLPLYTGLNYMHYSQNGEMKLPFIDSDLLCTGAN